MGTSDAEKKLTQHALKFHRALLKNQIYHTPISDEEFLARTASHISERARNINKGIESRESAILSLPVGIMSDLFDVVSAASWDYEFGYGSFFEELEKLFQNTGYAFAWDHQEANSRIEYGLNDQRWHLENADLDEELDPTRYGEVIRNLSTYMQQKGQKLYEPVTGDQTGMLLLMPIRSESKISKILVSVDDPRAENLY